MPKILWQNDKNEMTRRRANQMIRQGMVEGEGKNQSFWQEYSDSQAGLSAGEQEEQDAALREQGLEPSRAGLSLSEQERLPDDPRNAPMHSGSSSGGSSGMDLRTDTYLVKAAKSGDLKGFKDRRSRGFNALFGPGGPLSGEYTYEELEANPKLKELHSILTKVMNATPRPQKTQVDFVNMPFPINTSKEAAAVEAYMGGDVDLKGKRSNSLSTSMGGMLSPFKRGDAVEDEEEELEEQIRALRGKK